MTDQAPPTFGYWHLWTDAEGVSRQTRCSLTEFELSSIQPQAAAQWIGSKTKAEMTTFVTVLPVGWTGDWHENPKPQWIIPLSGRWFVESMDGQRVEMGQGDISFGEDQHTKVQGGKQGHFSGVVGDAPAVLMIVQLSTVRETTSPCRFR
jgi:hypothetical protein